MREVHIDRLVKLHLKYCEACGTLVLRPAGEGVYCEVCRERMARQAWAQERIPGRRV